MSDSPALNDSERLVRIETLLQGFVANNSDHEVRIRRLERALWMGMGICAAIGSAVGSFVGSIALHH